jgi:hypothetical protein
MGRPIPGFQVSYFLRPATAAIHAFFANRPANETKRTVGEKVALAGDQGSPKSEAHSSHVTRTEAPQR